MRTLILLACAALTGLTSGCGEGKQRPKPGDEGRLALEDFGRLLKGLPRDNLKPPTNPRELEPLEPAAPVGTEALKNKKIVYLWGGGYVAGGTKVVAYEANADSAGGYVLLEDGSVKQMTAEELKAAPKAGKP